MVRFAGACLIFAAGMSAFDGAWWAILFLPLGLLMIYDEVN